MVLHCLGGDDDFIFFFFIVVKDKVFKNDGENMIRLGKSEVFKIHSIVHKLVNELFLQQ